MREKKSAIRDQAISASGGVLGTGLGALIGPEAAFIGGAVGSVGALLAAKFAPEYFANTAIYRFLSNRKVVAILAAKIGADLDHSFLNSQGDFDRAMSAMRSFLEAAHAEDPAIPTLESLVMRGFRWSVATADVGEEQLGQHLRRLAVYCRANGPIRFGASAISCAPIAIVRDLHRRFADEFGVEFAVEADEINGRMFFDSLRTTCELDFAVGPLEALVLSDPDRQLPLRIIGPVCGQRQLVFVSTKKRVGLRSGVWVFSRSSAKFQYQVGVGMPRNVEEQAYDDARQVPDLVESIPAGDLVIAWDPLSSVLDGRKDVTVVQHSEYIVHFVLLGHRHVFRKNQFPLHDFLAVFLAEWRRRRQTRDGLVELLRRDPRFMTAFARGAGHRWTPEV
jgi:hypothetical protein